MSEQVTLQRISLENWMGDLPEQLRKMPFIHLAIPGSHDSMTYQITRASGLAPDAQPVLHRIYPLFRGTILRWTITQSLTAVQQLQIGIRYFDLRLATKNGTDQFFFTHGLYAGEISEPLNEIKQFMDAHPKEAVVLDFQHLYAFTPDDHRRLASYLVQMFGRKLVPRQLEPQTVSLGSMGRLGQQYVVIYRHESVYSTGEFWPGQMMPSPWPRADRPQDLLRFFETVRRRPGTGFVHQAVLTPTPTFIVLRWASNLRDKCAVPVKKEVLPRLAEFSPGPPHLENSRAPVNVVIADFVELDDSAFTKTIIQLNMKLIRPHPLCNFLVNCTVV